ncbi:hypothetical protein QUC31_005234, partial [Theobroma cacao]
GSLVVWIMAAMSVCTVLVSLVAVIFFGSLKEVVLTSKVVFLLRNGTPKGAAIVIAFLVYAVFHELCIAVPCHMYKLWAFIGIMFQVGVGTMNSLTY